MLDPEGTITYQCEILAGIVRNGLPRDRAAAAEAIAWATIDAFESSREFGVTHLYRDDREREKYGYQDDCERLDVLPTGLVFSLVADAGIAAGLTEAEIENVIADVASLHGIEQAARLAAIKRRKKPPKGMGAPGIVARAVAFAKRGGEPAQPAAEKQPPDAALAAIWGD